MGNPRWRIALFPHPAEIMPALLVQATLSIAAAIIAEAALSFLGLGQQPPAPSWGSMLNAAQRFLTNAPWMAAVAGACDFPVVLSFNLVATACATHWIRANGDPRVCFIDRGSILHLSRRERSDREAIRVEGCRPTRDPNPAASDDARRPLPAGEVKRATDAASRVTRLRS